MMPFEQKRRQLVRSFILPFTYEEIVREYDSRQGDDLAQQVIAEFIAECIREGE